MTGLIIAPEAEADLRDIGDYIAQSNLDAAITFVERIRQRCNDVADFPASGRKRDEIKVGYRSVTEGSYVVFYRIQVNNAIEVLRILHAKRDLGKISFAE